MTYWVFCKRCMRGATRDLDVTPDPACKVCAATGYTKAAQAEIARHLAQNPYPEGVSRGSTAGIRIAT